MLKTTKLLSITVPKPVYREIHREAKKRNTTVSGLLRTAFEGYVQNFRQKSQTRETERILLDKISTELHKGVDKFILANTLPSLRVEPHAKKPQIHHGKLLLKELKKIQFTGGDPHLSRDIDKIVYGV